MAYKAKAYTLREESTESGIRYFISLRTGRGNPRTGSIRAVILNFGRWNAGTGIFSNGTSGTGSFRVWDETLNRRALRVPKSIEKMIEEERANCSVRRLTDCQRYKGGVSCSTTSMSSIFTKSPLWSIAPLLQYRNLLLLQRRK